MGDTDVVAAHGLKAHGKENLTWAQAMRSKDASHLRDAARARRCRTSSAMDSTWRSARNPVADMERVHYKR
eukprot:4976427-Pleurochrysis_carterae.AAC.1